MENKEPDNPKIVILPMKNGEVLIYGGNEIQNITYMINNLEQAVQQIQYSIKNLRENLGKNFRPEGDNTDEQD